LEAEVVVVTDVESLPVMCNDDDDDVLSRCRVYVAITRAQRRLIWIYYDTRHRLVSDLVKECRTALTAFSR
jgi:superfamily I DNA/RNA helicase